MYIKVFEIMQNLQISLQWDVLIVQLYSKQESKAKFKKNPKLSFFKK